MIFKLKCVHLTADEANGITFPNLKDHPIEKTGHTEVFTLNQVEAAKTHYLKTLKELRAQVELDSAKMVNIEGFHPEVLDYTPEQLFTAWMYQESKGRVKVYGDKITEIEEQLKADDEEVAEIYAQIPELQALKDTEQNDKPTN